jgi:hypothetical protein
MDELTNSNLKAIAWHLEQGEDNGWITREALALFFRSIVTHLEASEKRVEELEARIASEQDFAAGLADKGRLIAIKRAEKAEASLSTARSDICDLNNKYHDTLSLLAAEREKVKRMREAIEKHKKNIPVAYDFEDLELYKVLDEEGV